MREASVGFQCPECVNRGQASVRQPRTMAGGAISTNTGAITLAIIAINVAAQLVVMATGGARSPGLSRFFETGAMLGLASYDGAIHGVADGEYWRLITAAFLHGGLLHLAFNMYALYLFGPYVEQTLGRLRYVVTYLTLAVGSSVFVYLLTDSRTLTIGASGAVFGLFGLALVFLVRTRQNITGMLVLLAINGFISLGAGISWQGHLGGFLTGLLLGLMFAYAPRDRRTLVQAGTFVALAVLFIAAVVWRNADLRAAVPGLG
jgi:membrane associated rhomboid family serine protease